jgi:hypothetical protein
MLIRSLFPADDRRKRQMRAAETRLLYENATTGTAVTIVIAAVIAYAHWDLVSHVVVSAWLVYMLLASAGIGALRRATTHPIDGARRSSPASRWRLPAGVAPPSSSILRRGR